MPKVTEEQTKGISRKLEGTTKKVEPNGHFNALGWAVGVTALAGGAYLIATKGKGHLALSKTVAKEVSAEVPAVTKAIEAPIDSPVTPPPSSPHSSSSPPSPPHSSSSPSSPSSPPPSPSSSSVEPVQPAKVSVPATPSSKVKNGSQTQPTKPHFEKLSTPHSTSSVGSNSTRANLSTTEQTVVAGFAKDAKAFIDKYQGVGRAETAKSIGDRRTQADIPPVLEEVTRSRSNYYSVQLDGEQYLVPRHDFQPNTYALGSCEALFEIPADALDNLQTKGWRLGLVKPAKIKPDGTLKEKGILEVIVL